MPHAEFHRSLDMNFWDLFREGGPLFGKKPTYADYDAYLPSALRHAGYSRGEAERITREATDMRRQLAKEGFPVGDKVPMELPKKRTIVWDYGLE